MQRYENEPEPHHPEPDFDIAVSTALDRELGKRVVQTPETVVARVLPPTGVAEGLEVSPGDLLENRDIQCLVCHQAFQSGILFFKRL